jgi:hypothetical protein
MAWYHTLRLVGRPPEQTKPSDTATFKDYEAFVKHQNAITAASSPVKKPAAQFLQHTMEWQNEAWGFYDNLPEMNTGVTWLANMLSRVRLKAAEIEPGLDEPTVQDKGLGPDVMAQLSGGVGGQAQLMRNLTIQLSVPGDCYMIGQGTQGAELWQVRSIDEVRVQNGKFQTVTDRIPNIVWSDLPAAGMPVRIWRPHARYYHLADSTAHSALSAARELDMCNRFIMSQYLSRLASAGLLVMPSEATFPVREEFQDEPDPMMAEMIEISAEAIRTPGTAAGIVPIMIKVPGELAAQIRHIDFTLKIDEKIIEKRESAIQRLGNKLDVPVEIMTGMAKVNHWTAWQLDEGSLKTHIAPMAEVICDALTSGYLRPRLKASGATDEEIAKAVVWYDMSELAVRPDKSENATLAYDRLELGGAAYRRELGFDEDDAPTNADLEEQALKTILRLYQNEAPYALDKLVGHSVLAEAAPAVTGTPGTPPPAGNVPPQGENPQPEDSTQGKSPGAGSGPANEGKTPKGPGKPSGSKATQESIERLARVTAQLAALHLIKFNKARKTVTLMHPETCSDHSFSCPFTHAMWEKMPATLSTGTYECRLGPAGLHVGEHAPQRDDGSWIEITKKITPVRRQTSAKR